MATATGCHDQQSDQGADDSAHLPLPFLFFADHIKKRQLVEITFANVIRSAATMSQSWPAWGWETGLYRLPIGCLVSRRRYGY